MNKLSIIGFGRFGKTIYNLLKDDFDIVLFSRSKINSNETKLAKNTIISYDLREVYKSDTVIYAVPISAFDQILSEHHKYFRPDQLLIDMLSVKVYPAEIFKKYLKRTKTQALLTHPIFGPDSTKNGFEGLPIVVDKFKTSNDNYDCWLKYFKEKKLHVIEMTAEEHDKTAANSHGLTHFIGRLLDDFGLQKSPMDTLGTKKLLEIKEQTCNDSWQLFTDLQQYNPYTKNMRIKLGESYDKLFNMLISNQLNPGFLTYGIQGGKGSFNEEALKYYLERNEIKNFKIKYLYTTENVLSALHNGEIDRGQFAIHSSVGGIVQESIEAVSKYKFKIIDQFSLKIAPALMIRKDANFEEVTTIMTHPQVYTLTKNTLFEKYPQLEKTSGKGELIDHSMVAKFMSDKKLPKHIATMGSRVLAEIYDLKLVEENLQDTTDNFTAFLLVGRS